MAMQHSHELLDVASIVFQQVKSLGVPQWDCGVNIWNKGDSSLLIIREPTTVKFYHLLVRFRSWNIRCSGDSMNQG